ncbi:MAG: 2-phospho-L-lactate guanylyltransferase [Pseudomonadales bacterium]|nr:2-phospho-L-lactate guanylyltransferase [Pseudomonadales bacterium]
MWAIVPVKAFRSAKHRLAPLLSAEERCRLARTMAEDVFAMLAATGGLTRVLVVTADPEAADLARAAGFQTLADTASDLDGAVNQAIAHARSQGAASVCILHADLPLATSAELGAVLEAHAAAGPAARVTLVPDHEGRGTNCLVLTPPDVIEVAYGEDSRHRHASAAARAGARLSILERPGLARDLDTAADLRAVAQAAGRSRSVAFLESSGIASRSRREAEIARAAQGPVPSAKG